MTSPSPAPAWVALLRAVARRVPLGRYRLIHLASRRPPAPFLARMAPESGGAEFTCDLRDAVAREVCFTGVYEAQETALVRAILGPGHTFVDVGASWGYFSLLAAHLVGSGGRVIALEPDPRSYEALSSNCNRNGLDQVRHVQVAAAERAGTLTLEGFDAAAGNFGVSRIAREGTTSSTTFQVQAEQLDALLEREGADRVALLKMDVEGGEAAALAGLRRALAGGTVERLLLELHPVRLAELGENAAELVQRVLDAGYDAWAVDHSAAATRRAAYGRSLPAAEWLLPFEPETLGPWPHVLFARRGLAALPS